MSKPTFAELKAARRPATRTVPIVLDGETVAEIARLDTEITHARVADAKENRTPVAPQLEAQRDALLEHLAGSIVEFTFRQLPRREYRDLIAAHPPVEEDRRWNDETFYPALVAAASVEPKLTNDDATEIAETWGEADWWIIAQAAVAVQEDPTRVPFTLSGTARTDASPPSSTTAPNGA